MSNNNKPVFWASSSRLNEPESILKEQGWHKGSRPAASDFNWLFNTMQKDIHALKLELERIKEKLSADIDAINSQATALKTSTALIKKTADHSLREAHANRRDGQLCLRAVRDIHVGLNDLVNELRHFNPSLRSRNWQFRDEFDLIDER